MALSIETDGLIEPIITRQKGDRYELIAVERRLRALKKYTQYKTVEAKIIDADDLQARRISAVETIEAIIEIVDAHLIEDNEYAAMGITPESSFFFAGKTSFNSCQPKQTIKYFRKWYVAV